MKRILVFIGLVFIFVAVAALAQQQTATTAPYVVPQQVNATVDKDSLTALAPLAKQRAELQQEIQTLIVKYQLVNAQWRIAEGKALATANLDPGEYSIDPTGQKFIKRPGGPRPQ